MKLTGDITIYSGVFSIIGMVDFAHSYCMQVRVGCQMSLSVLDITSPLWICIPSLLGTSAQGNGKSFVIVVIYQQYSLCFSFEAKFLAIFIIWIRLKPMKVNA